MKKRAPPSRSEKYACQSCSESSTKTSQVSRTWRPFLNGNGEGANPPIEPTPWSCDGRPPCTPPRRISLIHNEFRFENGKAAGTAEQADERSPLDDFVVSGTRMTWSQRVAKPMKLHLKLDVAIDGGAMAGTAKPELLPASRLEGRSIS